MKSVFDQNNRQLQEEISRISLSNVGKLLKYAKRLQKIQGQRRQLKVAVLGTCSIQYFVQVLQTLLFRDGICAEVYEGRYDGIKADILDVSSAFYKFHPDVTVILNDYRDIREFPGMFDTEEQVTLCVGRILEEIKLLWNTLHRWLPDCQVIQSNYVVPVERVLGNLECNYAFSHQSVYRRVNEGLVDIHPMYVLLADVDYLASIYGKLNWLDSSAYMLLKAPFALKYTGFAASLFAKLVGACVGIVRKCIVLDLDNTLWGGIVSEEGPMGIYVGLGDAVSEAFYFFQGYLKQLEGRGIILAVCSKNEKVVAEGPFRLNPDMILKLDDFAAFYAGWEDKASNIQKLAKEIGIGLDSIVFFDDNPAEREQVKVQLPQVEVIDVPQDPADYVRALELSGCFQWAALTPEDGTRAATYAADRERSSILAVAGDYNAYLQQLSMHGSVREVESSTLRRFAQLINKSNQFNLRTKRYTQVELSGMMGRGDCKLLAGSLADKFSAYGIVSCVILTKDEECCFIDTWVMSCRVLKRGLEYMVFRHILEAAREWGCTRITGEFIPTEKNGVVRTLLPELGFLPEEEDKSKAASRYFYRLRDEFRKECFISEDGI